jgi:hypothetical protein
MGKKGKSKYDNIFKEGDKFGKYTIIDSNVELKREAQIKCRCDCGKVNFVSCYTLLNGKSKGCVECNVPREKSKNPSWKGCENISGKYYNRIKRNAEKRNIVFDVDIEYLNMLIVEQNFKCNLSNMDIGFSHSKKDNYTATASIDRIDSKLGYVRGNLQWIHKDVNLMKNYFDQEYFINICERIINGRKNKYKST